MSKYFKGLTILFIIINFQHSKGAYFTPSFTGNPFSPMSFLVSDVTVDSKVLDIGDEIGIFDKQLCVGSFVFNGQFNFGMSASMSDPTSNSAGFITGDKIEFRIWTKKSNQLIRNITVIYGSGMDSINFKAYGISMVSLIGKNDPARPEIKKNQSFSIPENLKIHSFVGKVTVQTADAGTYYFEIQSGDENKFFTIDSIDGTIYLNRSVVLNYEENNRYNLLIKLYNADFNWVYDSALVQVSITKVVEQLPIIQKNTTDTAFAGTPFTSSIDLSDFNEDSVLISSSEIPSWISYREENGRIVLEGMPELSELGDYNLIFMITDGYKTINNQVSLKVISSQTPLSLTVQNNPSQGNYSVTIEHSVLENVLDINVYNLSGIVVYKEKLTDPSEKISLPIDLSGNTKNIYILEVKTNKSRETSRLVLL